MSRLLNSSSLSATQSTLTKTRKRHSRGTNCNVDRVFFSWITDCFNKRVSINGPLIRAKAAKLQEEYNNGVVEPIRTRLNFSEGWLAGFKRRWGLKTFRSHGESGDCDDGAVQSALPSIREKLVRYSEKDIFNAE